MSNKPLPLPTETSRPYWEALKAHRVDIQQCGDCGHWIFFPRQHCPHCFSHNLAWKTISGQGTLLTYTTTRIPTLPEFTDEMPQQLAVVQLDEGPHVNTTLVGLAEDEIRIGMRVKPVFHDVDPGKATLLRYTGPDKHVDLSAAAPAQAAAPVVEAPAVTRRQINFRDLEAMKSLVSEEYSAWSNEFTVTQEIINQFAALSGDDYWIHTDPEKAKKQSPFGTTIAHGALVQVLTSQLSIPMTWEVTGFNNMVNYGSDKLRFPSPVPSGSRIRARCRVKAVEQVKSGTQLTLEICIHVVGMERPSVINELVILYM
ncbi:MAG TPA: MaoC/PaaZ C-terminal domain-containing protein [Rhodocyclaceae bacterium]|nr:MaoC/PaaZ C-terminal domain-containing protein [Rhodocyclaceae bacterium]